VIAQTIDVMEREILKYRIIDADMLLRPKVGKYSTTTFNKVDEIIREGERATTDAVGDLQEMIQRWKESNQHV
jgi:NTE family protein